MEIKLKKIHKVLNIDKSRWFKPYFGFNTEENKNSYNELEKEAFNLMKNSTYRKTIENLANRVDVKLQLILKNIKVWYLDKILCCKKNLMKIGDNSKNKGSFNFE